MSREGTFVIHTYVVTLSGAASEVRGGRDEVGLMGEGWMGGWVGLTRNGLEYFEMLQNRLDPKRKLVTLVFGRNRMN